MQVEEELGRVRSGVEKRKGLLDTRVMVDEGGHACGALLSISELCWSRERTGNGLKGVILIVGVLKDCSGRSAENGLPGGSRRCGEPLREESGWEMRVARKPVVAAGTGSKGPILREI